jgi:hypothetical protein
MLELLHEPQSQQQAFVNACAWAEEIYLCLAWIEPGDARGPSFADLKPYESKVRQAIVGLARFQSYPALLRRLYRSSVLRLVSTVDGSFSPNCYLFRKGSRVRVLLASAPFTSSRFARPCESLVVFEGERDDPFALRALQLLDRCRASAHVPTATELDAYEEAWAEVRTGGRAPETILGLALEPGDAAALDELTLVDGPSAILEALVEVRDSLSATAAVRVPGELVPRWTPPRDGLVSTILYWSPFGMWSALSRSGSLYGLHFGFVQPWEVERPVAALSLIAGKTPSALGELAGGVVTDAMAIARGDDGRRFLVHFTAEAQDYTADLDVRDASGAARATLIGEVGAADFVQTAAAFALRVSRRRALRDLEPSS